MEAAVESAKAAMTKPSMAKAAVTEAGQRYRTFRRKSLGGRTAYSGGRLRCLSGT
jgi:hypothetical protein